MRKRNNRAWISGFATLALSLAWISLVATAKAATDLPLDSEREPVDVIFVLDNSGSMRENDPAFLTRAAVMNFASALAGNPAIAGRIAVVLFDGKARLVRDLTAIRDGETEALLQDALAELDFSGQRTNSPVGIERALYEFRQNGRDDARRVIVLLTDGVIDTGNAQGDLEAARWLREDLAGESEASGIRIFGVAFTEAADYQLMQALARRTHARYYRAFEASELSGVVEDVLSRVADDEFYELALADANPNPMPSSDGAVPPDVSAAPLAKEDRTNFVLLGLLPAMALLVAGALLWRRRSRSTVLDPVLAQARQEMDAPPAMLLDVGGQLGEAGAAIELVPGQTRIGRDAHNDIVLDDETISSEHAVIEVHGGRYWLEDRRSTNGTRLGDQRLAPENRVQLKGGDHIRLADIDLMFVLAGYVPGGATVFVNSTTTPPSDWKPEDHRAPARGDGAGDLPDRIGDDIGDDIGDIIEPEEGAARAGQLSLLESPEPEDAPDDDIGAREDEPRVDAPASSTEAAEIRHSLDYHLERVAEISPAFESFIARAFDDEIRAALSVAAHDLTSAANEIGRIITKDYTFDRVRFVICGVPGEMETARDAFIQAFGGFTRMLSEQLHADSFQKDRCEILAVLTFGVGDAPWVSLSIVPDEDQDPQIDLLSYEFLTAEERRDIEPGEHTDLSQSGLG